LTLTAILSFTLTGDIMRTEVHEYGAQWKDKLKAAPTNILAAFKNQILYILEERKVSKET
jgi:hypothetical protein